MSQQPDAFPWRTDQQAHFRRVMAAFALIGAGWAVGFFSGRMSAWVFPVAPANVTAQKVRPEPAPRVHASARFSADAAAQFDDQKGRPNLALSPPPAEPEQRSVPKQSADQKIPQEQVREPKSSATKAQSPERQVVVVNPNWSTSPSEQIEREPEGNKSQRYEGDANAVAECQGRFSSFRASDGTYQPYGRSSRALCPLLK